MWWGMQNNEQFTAGPPQMIDGVLYLKGMRSQKLYAVDPIRPRVVWHRPISRLSNLIGVDDSRFYLGGDDISAYDLKTRKILWSVKLHMGTSWAHAILTQGRIYHFSSRGIFEIDKTDGKVVRVFRGGDLDSLGGNVVVTPKMLLTVSNLAVTAYPLTSEPIDAKPNATSAVAVPADRAIATTALEKQ
jgi:outer membrane protein assembly factor BamB